MVPDPVTAFAQDVVSVVRDHLAEHLVGVYLFGSVALDDWHPESSDIDIAAVCAQPLDHDVLQALSRTLLGLAAHAPARGLEFVLFTTAQAAEPDGSVALNVNGGPGMATQVDIDHADFWFALDTSILRDTAVTLAGSPADEVFGRVPDPVLHDALEQSLAWHADHAAERPHATVLAACRSWRFLEEGIWSDKTTAARWAAQQSPQRRPLIEAALKARRGETDQIAPDVAADMAMAVRAQYR